MKHNLIIGKYTLESLTNGMYSSPLDLYREYVQNAVDSFDMLESSQSIKNDSLNIYISLDYENRKIVIKDNGMGIPQDEAIPTLIDIGNSRKNRTNCRGFRGIGRLAGLGYCSKLIFKTSSKGESSCTKIEFDANMLNKLLLPSNNDSISINDVIDKIASVEVLSEKSNISYFEVILEDVYQESGLMQEDVVKEYLIQHAPIPFLPSFKWQSTILEKVRLAGYKIPQYHLFLNGEELYKPYTDMFVSDRVKKNEDHIKDIKIRTFSRGGQISAILWYAQINYFGTINDNTIKGIRIRQGNILLGDKSSFNRFFKEERFNGWMIGELHVFDNELIANSRRDGFEVNAAFYELSEELRKWAFEESKEIRHLSYERSLTAEKKAIVEANTIEDINDLCTEELEYDSGATDSSNIMLSESDEIAEYDYIDKLSLFINQKKIQTKYTALNINQKLTIEQRKILERVFDIIKEDYGRKTAEKFINTIAYKF